MNMYLVAYYLKGEGGQHCWVVAERTGLRALAQTSEVPQHRYSKVRVWRLPPTPGTLARVVHLQHSSTDDWVNCGVLVVEQKLGGEDD